MDAFEQSITKYGKSQFVTILAWISIALSGFTTFISILQNIMITFMFPMEKMNEAFKNPKFANDAPKGFTFIFSNFRLIIFGFLLVSTITLVSSIGLLKRKNWARIIFICIMTLGILWNFVGIYFQNLMMPKFSEFPKGPGAPDFEKVFLIMRIFSVIMAIGFSVLFGWIIKKLVSEKIKEEFSRKSN